MSYVIAAAGTGGHVFPGLSVGEALVAQGVARRDVLFVGGNRLEAAVYPAEGFPFLGLQLRGLQRGLTMRNLSLPLIVWRAKRRIESAFVERGVRSVLGMGGYVTIPTALAARKTGIPLHLAEQNARAGLANKVSSRWARRVFVSFPDTGGLEEGEWVGNPVREPFWSFDRERLRAVALAHYGLGPDLPVLGVFGGSLGAQILNTAVSRLLQGWDSAPMQVVHITGESHFDGLAAVTPAGGVVWKRMRFEEQMELFYAVSDLVLARAGGAVAELTATATPAVLVPGQFGSAGHQRGNARYLTEQGAAVTLEESQLDRLGKVIETILFDPARREAMAESARRIARPQAAEVIARALIEAGR